VGRIAVTGTASFLGSRLLRRLVESRGLESVLALDVAPPPAALGAVPERRVDLTEAASDQLLLDIFRGEGIDTVVHLAFFTNPRRDSSYAHELESIGTLNLLAAAAEAGVKRVLVRSFTAVYGARGSNPNFLTEDRMLQPNLSLAWAADKFEAEQHTSAFVRRYPEMKVTALRFAPMLGPGIHNFYTRILDNRVVPVLMGYDPLVQFLHPDDALTALERALDRDISGPINIVPARPIALLTALHLAGKIPLPVPHPFGYLASDLLWASGIGAGPGAFLDYVRFLFVADGERARRDLGFEARYSSRGALDAYLSYPHPTRGSRQAEVRL